MLLVGVLALALGAIPLGSKAAFTDLVGSFIILSSVSYAIPIAGHLFSGRKSIRPGPFWMGKAGFVVQTLAVLCIIFFDVMYCFRKYPAISLTHTTAAC
jgi:hypothetical protein